MADSAARRLVGDERVLLLVYVAVAALFTTDTKLAPHLTWSRIAFFGYVVAFAVALRFPNRGLGALTAVAFAVVVPTVYLAWMAHGQPEVSVVVDGARDFLQTGSPYLASPDSRYDYRPYLPAIFVFGLPAATLYSHLLDPRLLALAFLVACLTASVRLMGLRHQVRQVEAGRVVKDLALTLSCPFVAVSIATSFIDIPQAALTVLSIAAISRGRGIAGGIATGLCLAMKPTALCALFVLFLFARVRHSSATALRFGVTSLTTAALLIGPFVVSAPGSIWDNALLFPLGRIGPESPAQSPFPGVLLREAGLPGPAVTTLAAVVGLAYAVVCLRRMNGSALRAAGLLAVGLTLLFMMAPYSRTGYLVLPLIVYFSIRAMRPGATTAADMTRLVKRR
ncbi:MAG: hypothetical protein JWO11_2721 [Nocardioides sp.]|nr:hypothetical protein [Nocardioides sp.]